jgi:dUTP pyrophosphatase
VIIMNVYKVNEKAEIPAYATQGSACFDIKACITKGQYLKSYNSWNREQPIVVKGVGTNPDAFQLPPGIRVLVPTGLIFDIPENNVLKMFIRSSVALKKGLVMANGTGIIDSDYVEESYMMLQNVTDSLVTIENGDRLVQCMLVPVEQHELVETTDRPEQKTDRNGGFGSTG